ncbi:MAG: RluA family pseudouridine synthase [Anaerolineae bacterium]|nr:RluA family pseudouridine synthase [Thermoflexus sp.]MDW8065384.1 RluA family pseudouridine synthase [Anaerolineae bacterium]
MTSMRVETFIVEACNRLDRAIAVRLPELTRSAAQRLIERGLVSVNGAPVLRPAHRIRSGDQITVHIPPPEPVDLIPEPIPLDVLYEDQDVLVIQKPAGMVVHPGAGHARGTLIHAILAHCPGLEGVGGILRPGLVHRLDKETSGVLLVAKNERTYHFIQAQFKARMVRKVYDALVIGHPPPEGTIEAPIARDPGHRRRMAVVLTGRPARTRYRVLKAYEGRWGRYAWLEVYPETGRTHQIRVHLAYVGYPIVGDPLYGRRAALPCPRLFLHARALTVRLPLHPEPMTFEAPLPPDLREVLRVLEEPSIRP